MNNNLTNLMFCAKDSNEKYKTNDPKVDLVTFGKELLTSEELTDHIYSCFLNMIIDKGFAGDKGAANISDFGYIYLIGPYIPCTSRITLIGDVDLKNDGMPGVSVTAGLNPNPKDFSVTLIRPVEKIPSAFPLIGKTLKKFKMTCVWQDKKTNWMESFTSFFGINQKGKIITPIEKRYLNGPLNHAGISTFSSIAMNAQSDARFLWLAKTSEDIGIKELKLRLGLNKEHIKSLFYARSLPVTDTGRKRPILHWVKSHNRRIKEGIDIDIKTHLRGIETFEMDGLRIEITQPRKNEYKTTDSLKKAYEMYAWGIDA